MKRLVLTFALSVVLLIGAVLGLTADVPQLMNYQGVLLDGNDDPVTGPVEVTFGLWGSEVAGFNMWSETLTIIPDANGVFSVLLGLMTPIPDLIFDGTDRWLSIQVENDPELSPRIRLAAVGYSYRVNSVDGALGGTIQSSIVVQTDGSSAAVRGENDNATDQGYGVWGSHDSGGTGVYGSSADGWGVYGASSNGIAGYFKNFAASNMDPALYVEIPQDAAAPDVAQFKGGSISVLDASGTETIAIDPHEGSTGGQIVLRKTDGTTTIEIDGDRSDRPEISLYNGDGDFETVELIGTQNSDGTGGFLTMRTDNGSPTIFLDAEDGSTGGKLVLARADGTQTVEIDAEQTDGGATFRLSDGTQTTIWMDARGAGGGGGALFYNSSGTRTMEFDADEDDAATIRLFDAGGEEAVEILAAEGSTGSQITLKKADGTATIVMDAEEGSGGGSDINLYNGDGDLTIQIDADWEGSGEGRVSTQVLQITGGSDLSEQFDVQGALADVSPAPGMVVCIDSEHPGELVVSSKAYDRTVAGVISGAGGVKPGMLMGQLDSPVDGEYPVALTGRVYCLADASHGSIEPGDLMTTSTTPGHAMKVTHYNQAQGAIIGKAMSALRHGTGLVLVLISLQ
ncbi:MAG: hypothetical protein JSV84_17880 [Gemmatimonadota bacterium]|nr:MAG: hypothetical protein JSV84_17880 [Gemmatimonadota bacterium]